MHALESCGTSASEGSGVGVSGCSGYGQLVQVCGTGPSESCAAIASELRYKGIQEVTRVHLMFAMSASEICGAGASESCDVGASESCGVGAS